MEVLYCLKENERLLLDDPEKVWVAIGGKLFGVADSWYESTFRLMLQNSPSSGLIAIGKSGIHTCIQQTQKIESTVNTQQSFSFSTDS